MSKLIDRNKLRLVFLPLVGVLGTLCALGWPAGHAAFCAGVQALVG